MDNNVPSIIVIATDNINKFTASDSSSGRTIANSYLPVAKMLIRLVNDVNRAKVPKSPGAYNLVNIGDIAIGIAWAIVVPIIKVNTWVPKEPLPNVFSFML